MRAIPIKIKASITVGITKRFCFSFLKVSIIKLEIKDPIEKRK
jgi:hypothetical protein